MQKIGNNVAYFAGLAQVPDPSIKNLPARLQSLSTLYAIQGPTGNFFYKTQLPGRSERSALPVFRGLGSFTFNIQLSKAVTLNRERNITLRLRADALNVLNKPIWNTPNLNIDSTSFGQITGATGNRNIVLGARVEF